MKNIYMVQPNAQYGNSIYFPYAAGCLIAYSFSDASVRNEYDFKGFFYKKSDIEDVVSRLQNPYLIGFSCYVWNYEYNKALAARIKQVYPDCLTVFGGHQVSKTSDILQENYVDFCIFGEGEEIFRSLLCSLGDTEKIENICNIAYRKDGKFIFTPTCRIPIPERVSPYLFGCFDTLVKEERELVFSAILETNRGCPNKCAFCDWGNEKARVKLYDLQTVKAEIDWMAANKIEYCYCADANFGLFERDTKIVDYLIAVNSRCGYPQKFQATYSKNNPETVFEINKRLNDARMSKGATLSFQSMHQHVLDNIYRKNMPIESFHNLMSLYNKNAIGAYSELILGLPGETNESFADGIEQLLECGQHMSINFFNCELLVNSVMSDPAYMAQHAIEYAITEQHQYHVVPNKTDIPEFSRIVVSTASMSKEDWIKSNILSVFVRAFHNLGLLQCIAIYLHYEKKLAYTDFYCALIDLAKRDPDSICGKIHAWLEEKYRQVLQNTGSLTCTLPAFGELTWPLDEGAFLQAVFGFDTFYDEIRPFLCKYFDDKELLDELLAYQRNIVKNPYSKGCRLDLHYDFHRYYTNIYNNVYQPLQSGYYPIRIDSSDTPSFLPDYAKRVVWYGRKGGQNIIRNIEYATD